MKKGISATRKQPWCAPSRNGPQRVREERGTAAARAARGEVAGGREGAGAATGKRDRRERGVRRRREADRFRGRFARSDWSEE